MTAENITPAKLILKLAAYFLALISAMIILLLVHADALRYLPLGGTDALQGVDLEITKSRLDFSSEPVTTADLRGPITPEKVKFAVLFLGGSLAGTLLIMLPVTSLATW